MPLEKVRRGAQDAIGTGARERGGQMQADGNGGRFVTGFLDENGDVVLERVTQRFGLSKSDVAKTAGLGRGALSRSVALRSAKSRARLGEMLEIIARIADWAGGERQALAWYRAEPISSFGGRTAESLVKDGKAAEVRDYLDRVAIGGFA